MTTYLNKIKIKRRLVLLNKEINKFLEMIVYKVCKLMRTQINSKRKIKKILNQSQISMLHKFK